MLKIDINFVLKSEKLNSGNLFDVFRWISRPLAQLNLMVFLADRSITLFP